MAHADPGDETPGGDGGGGEWDGSDTALHAAPLSARAAERPGGPAPSEGASLEQPSRREYHTSTSAEVSSSPRGSDDGAREAREARLSTNEHVAEPSPPPRDSSPEPAAPAIAPEIAILYDAEQRFLEAKERLLALLRGAAAEVPESRAAPDELPPPESAPSTSDPFLIGALNTASMLSTPMASPPSGAQPSFPSLGPDGRIAFPVPPTLPPVPALPHGARRRRDLADDRERGASDASNSPREFLTSPFDGFRPQSTAGPFHPYRLAPLTAHAVRRERDEYTLPSDPRSRHAAGTGRRPAFDNRIGPAFQEELRRLRETKERQHAPDRRRHRADLRSSLDSDDVRSAGGGGRGGDRGAATMRLGSPTPAAFALMPLSASQTGTPVSPFTVSGLSTLFPAPSTLTPLAVQSATTPVVFLPPQRLAPLSRAPESRTKSGGPRRPAKSAAHRPSPLLEPLRRRAPPRPSDASGDESA